MLDLNSGFDTNGNAISQNFFTHERIIYHGSDKIIEHPDSKFKNPMNDYGCGFYCTEDLSKAEELAAYRGGSKGYVNKFALREQDLAVLDLTLKDFTPLHWVTMLVNHRVLSTDDMLTFKKAIDFLSSKYFIDISRYDVAIGYRADDSYFSFTRLFLGNQLSLQTLSEALNLGYVGKQVVLLSEKAYSSGHLQFISAEKITDPIYLKRYNHNDKTAREHFHRLRADDWQSTRGKKFIIDLMREDENNGSTL